MKTETITAEYASRYQQTKKFGIISEGCIGVWGEGETLPEAIEDALCNQQEFAGAASLDGCYAMEIAHAQ